MTEHIFFSGLANVINFSPFSVAYTHTNAVCKNTHSAIYVLKMYVHIYDIRQPKYLSQFHVIIRRQLVPQSEEKIQDLLMCINTYE